MNLPHPSPIRFCLPSTKRGTKELKVFLISSLTKNAAVSFQSRWISEIGPVEFSIGCLAIREFKVLQIHPPSISFQLHSKINIFNLFSDNWAFLYSQRLALKLKLPLHVCFCLVPKFLEATIRHYGFMLKGSKESIVNF